MISFYPVRLLSGGTGSIPTYKVQLAANNAIAEGDPVVIDGSGYVVCGAADSAQILGFAAETKSSSADAQDLLIYPALPWIEFAGTCSGTYAITRRNTTCDIEGSTGAFYVNENASAEDVIQITGEDPESEIGAGTVVYFVVIRSQFCTVLADQT